MTVVASPKDSLSRRSGTHVELFLRLYPNLLSWCRRLPAGPGRDAPTNSAWWGHAMSTFALVISRGSTNLAFPYVCAEATAAQGNVSVEVLLPKGGRRL